MIRLGIVRTVFVKELREMLRDRRSLAVMFGLPLVLEQHGRRYSARAREEVTADAG